MHNYHWCFSMNTSVTAEDLLVHYGSDGQAVEAVGESFPQLDVESAFTCKKQQDSESGRLEAKNLIICCKWFYKLGLDVET